MRDEALATTLRETTTVDDGLTWTRAATQLLRTGALERAARAAREAIARGADATSVVDATTPMPDALQARLVELALEGPAALDWTTWQFMDAGWSSCGRWVLASGMMREPGGPLWEAGELVLVLVDLEARTYRHVPGAYPWQLAAMALDAPRALLRTPGGVRILDLETGALSDWWSVPGYSVWTWAFRADPPTAFVAYHRRGASVFDLRQPMIPRRVEHVPCSIASFDDGGALAYEKRGRLVLHDARRGAPRARASFSTGDGFRRLFACGRRALVLDSDLHLTLHDSDGAPLARAPLDAEERGGTILPSASGLVLLHASRWRQRAGELSLLDVRGGARRDLRLPGGWGAATWSASGRSIAFVLLDRPAVVLLEPAQAA